MLSLLALLLLSTAQAGDPCGVGTASTATADLTTAVQALPSAETVAPRPPERNATTAPFLEPLQRRDRGALARMADERPEAFALATLDEVSRVIHMMQKGGTGDREERAIVNLLAGLEPLARAQVLRLIDQGRDKYDLDKLVYGDVDGAGRRARLLELIDESGRALTRAGAHELGGISDIDDTVSPMGHGDHFPGAGALYRDLEAGRDGKGQAGDIHYVTARPPLFLGDARGRLDKAGVPQGTIDDGSLGEAIFRWHDGFEDEKVRDIERQLRLHPGQRFVLIGDDTQRDPEVYRRILEAHPDRVAGIFIHRVDGKDWDPERYPSEQFVFFDDYKAARKAMADRGLVSR